MLLRLRCFSFGSLSLILLMLSSTSVVLGGSNGTDFNVSALAIPENNVQSYLCNISNHRRRLSPILSSFC